MSGFFRHDLTVTQKRKPPDILSQNVIDKKINEQVNRKKKKRKENVGIEKCYVIFAHERNFTSFVDVRDTNVEYV